jgi:hypothetical protein
LKGGKLEDKKEQERMKKMLLSHHISEDQIEELSKGFTKKYGENNGNDHRQKA